MQMRNITAAVALALLAACSGGGSGDGSGNGSGVDAGSGEGAGSGAGSAGDTSLGGAGTGSGEGNVTIDGTAPELIEPLVGAATGKPLARIPLTTARVADHPAWPLKTGIPLAMGQVEDLSQLTLRDADEHVVAAQFRPLARWADGSYKSVLVSLSSPLKAADSLAYVVDVAESTSTADTADTAVASTSDAAAEPERGAPVAVTSAEQLVFHTRASRIALDPNRMSLFDTVWIDRNADGTFDSSERVLDGGGEIYLVDAHDGDRHDSLVSSDVSYVIEEQGSEVTRVRATGYLHDAAGEPLTRYIVRYGFHRRSDLVEFEYTLVDDREEANVRAHEMFLDGDYLLPLSVAEYGLSLPFSLDGAAYRFGGEHGAVHEGALTVRETLLQEGKMHHSQDSGKPGSNYAGLEEPPFTFSFSGVASGEKAAGWVGIADDEVSISLHVKEFWQQFPKALAAAPEGIDVVLHPRPEAPDTRYPAPAGADFERPNTFYAIRPGQAKTYRFLLSLSNADDADPVRDNTIFQAHAPLLHTDPGVLVSSGVFGDVAEASAASAGYDEYLLAGIVDTSFDVDKGSYAQQYGWRDYGDRMRPGWANVVNGTKVPSYYNDTHVGANGFVLQYIRTGDPVWWALGEIASNHWMDIDVSHSNRLGYWSDANHELAGFGPGEGLMIKHENIDHTARNIHPGHAHISGLPYRYLLTGDLRTLEVMREVGDWWVNATDVMFPTPLQDPHYAEAERDYGWPLYVLLQVYRATGEQRYFDAAQQIVAHLVAWWKVPSEHRTVRFVPGSGDPATGIHVHCFDAPSEPCNDDYTVSQSVGLNQYEHGTGWWGMYPKQGNGCSDCNGSNPWMAGPLISMLHEFIAEAGLIEGYAEAHRALLDDAAEMALQTTEYIVRYGWDPIEGEFMYSEDRSNHDPGGITQIVNALTESWLLLQRATRSNPEWYTTSDRWIEIATDYYRNWREVRWRGSTAFGFYGYEMVFPIDFFHTMQALDDAGLLPDSETP
ncbi:MAG: hypothetical protein CSB44_12915 [Gammaproteobacteria bacterium]|nr:MAG: hypothetical protein CSB44_12915 [Gammaproteobacteria bacterium]